VGLPALDRQRRRADAEGGRGDTRDGLRREGRDRHGGTFTAKLEAGPAEEVLTALGGGHVVLGYGWNDYGYGSWSHTSAVLVTPRGRVIGKVKVSLFEPETPDCPAMAIKYTNDIDCVEIDTATGSAWLGGRISETSNPDFLPLGK